MKLKYVTIPLKIMKSFFLAVTQVAWGLLSIFGFNFILTYLLKENWVKVTEINSLFMMLESIILENVMWFVLAFFLLYLYNEIVDLKQQKE